jgi:hypothetical protein
MLERAVGQRVAGNESHGAPDDGGRAGRLKPCS